MLAKGRSQYVTSTWTMSATTLLLKYQHHQHKQSAGLKDRHFKSFSYFLLLKLKQVIMPKIQSYIFNCFFSHLRGDSTKPENSRSQSGLTFRTSCPWKTCFQKHASATHLSLVYYLPPFHWQRKTYLNSRLQVHTTLKFYIFPIPLALASLAWEHHCLTLLAQLFLRQMPRTVNNHFLWSRRLDTEILTAYLAKRFQAFQKNHLLSSYNLSQVLFQTALFQTPALTELSFLTDSFDLHHFRCYCS